MAKTIRIDGGFGFDREFHNTDTLVRQAQELEELGYDGLLVAEIAHDPFMPLAMAALHTERIELRTCIAVALARTPMNMANIGHDLNAYSKGRFTLGLGSQIKPHITKRFSMPWHGPARQMREYIEALHAIWDCWYDKKQLMREKDAIKYRIGFYGSTPAYKTVLDTHGWGDLQPRLNRMTKEGQWDQLPGEISDEVLHAFAAVGDPIEVATQIKQRFGGLIDRTALTASFSPEVLEQQMNILRA